MLLFRLILLFVVVFIAYRIYRLLIAPRLRVNQPPPKLGEDMVECALCAVRVPRGNAVTVESRWYCCEDHRRRHAEGRAKS